MSSALILQHVAHQGPGRIIPMFRDFGIACDVRHVYKGDEVPTDLEEIRVLIVLGGPMSVADAGSSAYPFLGAEIELIKRVIAADRPMLGICLGAQLLAHAAGAKVYPNVRQSKAASHDGIAAAPVDAPPPEALPELGWGPVMFPFPGGTEPIVFGLSDGTPMFHWHFDTFDLPKLGGPANPPPSPPPPTGNALLSSSKNCRNEAFRFKNRLFGFQYHFELTEAGIEALLSSEPANLAKAFGPQAQQAAQAIREETPKVYARYKRIGDRLLENFVQFLKTY
jgi:GMP synthase (glutamine-hydrolysing)